MATLIIPGISLPFTEPPEAALRNAKRLAGAENAPACIAKRAVDARRKTDIRFVYSVALELDGGEAALVSKIPGSRLVSKSPEPVVDCAQGIKSGTRPVVVGFGPAGMFAALSLARLGLRPVVIERGAEIERRVHDVEAFFQGGILNPESNIQFGEGGAGTFSDGKLTTRTHDPRSVLVLSEFVRHGAPEEILVRAKPHVGTDLLRGIVKSIRHEILALGGEIRFNTRLEGLSVKNGRIQSAKTSAGEIEATHLILAIGHSARDTFAVVAESGAAMMSKPFSAGVRVEHLQSDIDKALYGDFAGHPLLPHAEYQYSLREENRAVYTFCMCPGGVVVPAASEPDGTVTNGMSAYARDGENANAALVVSVSDADWGSGVFAGVAFQRKLEQAAFVQTGGTSAPAQDAGSFLNGKSGFRPGAVRPSYPRGVSGGDFAKIFPPVITETLKKGLLAFDRKHRGFARGDTVLTGVETRTSSPVRIMRGENLQADGVAGLFPCGEGAGYAGGIMSAAADGLRCAEKLVESLRS